MIKKLTIITTLITTVFLSGCDENKDKAKAIETAQNAVKKLMDDPRSAVFSDVKFVVLDSNQRAYMVCGKVNGKDKYGKDLKNEFATDIYDFKNDDEKFVGEWEAFPQMKYDLNSGILNESYYKNKYACTDGAEAFLKKIDAEGK